MTLLEEARAMADEAMVLTPDPQKVLELIVRVTQVLEIIDKLFNSFVSVEFIKADQLWRYEQWETLRNSPFPVLGPLPLFPSLVPADFQPPQPIPAP